ncbi:Wzz/FepE/Etk N-terminal domain-containing protein [Ekhidna sp.]|uniref:Wzz/FepE/Etk N-terminal domain-containing protein n=1 Tax=Ekhidna sp. TaxID=2608089 RepID=UPI003CCBEE98
MEKEKSIVQEDAIDFFQLIRLILSNRVFILKISSIFLFFGILIALISKVEFKASCKLIPENQDGVSANLGGLGGLAGLAGFDLSGLGASGELSPELFPEIVKSTPFMRKLINTPVYFEKLDTTISSFNYIKEIDRPSLFELMTNYTIGLPSKIRNVINGTEDFKLNEYGLVRFSKNDWELIEKFKDRLTVFIDTNTGTISVTVEMPDPVASAMVTDLLVNELTQSIIDYKIEKLTTNLSFIEERFTEAKKEYESKQEELARFADRNRNISNSIVNTEYERLQNELNISFEVYKGLATQLEQAKIKIEEETPVFTVLEPVRIPEKKSKPKRAIIVAVFTFLGIITALINVVWRNWSTIFIKTSN